MRRKKSISTEIGKREDLKIFLDSNKSIENIFDLSISLDKKRVALYKSLYQNIGKTPVIEINLPNNNIQIIKLEYENLLGSNHYSRFWIPYLFIAEELGIIEEGVTQILEVTSGSAGISLSTVCKLLNYQLTILVPSILPHNRVEPMRNSNTEILVIEGYVNDCVAKFKEMLLTDLYFAANHSEEKADIAPGVFKRIAYEIIDYNSNIDYSFLAYGNGTTLEAIASVLKEKITKTKVIAYQPNADKGNIVFGLWGLNPIMKLRHIEIAKKYVDEIVYTDDYNIKNLGSSQLFKELSVFGQSSLYGVAVGLDLAQKVSDKIFFSIAYDKIDRY